jgi:hypothetical protein
MLPTCDSLLASPLYSGNELNEGSGRVILPSVESAKNQWAWNAPKKQPAAAPHAQHNEEVRSSVRFPLHLPVQLASEGDGQVQATTEDISASGFLFFSEHEFADKTRMEFSIQMPAAVMGTPTDVVVHGSARVVRSYKKAPMNFTAAVIDDYSLQAAIGTHASVQQG